MQNLKTLALLTKNLTILCVEDDLELKQSLIIYLKKLFYKVDQATNGIEALEKYKQNRYDIIITDIMMPKMDGLTMASKIKQIDQNQHIIIVSAYSNTDDFMSSIKIGIDGYIIKPIDYDQLNNALYKISSNIIKRKENEEYKRNLQYLVSEKTKETQKLTEEKIKNYKKTLYALVTMIEERDHYTAGHSQRVAQYSKLIANAMNFDTIRAENIYQAGMLHDIGKIAIPDAILLKPSKLTPLEYNIIKEHVKFGVDVLKQLPMFTNLAQFVQEHHERYDGSGYPNGLKGDEILLESQIIAISDVFDAMTTSRIYKARKTVKEAIEELKSLTNKYFKEDIVKIACKVFKDITIKKNISQVPNSELENERFAYFYKDQITHDYNIDFLDLILRKNYFNKNYNFITIININNLDESDSLYTWKEKNNNLKNISAYLHKLYGKYLIFKVFDNKFILLSDKKLEINLDNLNQIDKSHNIKFIINSYNIIQNKIFSLDDLLS